MPLAKSILEAAREEARSNGSGSTEGEAEHNDRELKSSIDPQSFVIAGEDAGALEVVIESYRQSYLPGTALEWFLVDSLIAADWEMRRMQKIRSELLRKEIAAGATLAEAYERPTMARLEKRRAAVERSFYRAYKEIEKILKQENEAEAKDHKDQKEQGRTLVATLSALTKLGSFRRGNYRGAGGPLRPAEAGAPGGGPVTTPKESGPKG
jgi:hypothetical protein